MTDSTPHLTECNIVHYIYTLTDPRDDRIRYIGQTDNLKERYKSHCSRQSQNNHRAHWLNKLRSLDLKPIMRVIEECDESNWADREIYWIRYYREISCSLVNATNGGEGVVGYIASEQTRQKLSVAAKGRMHTTETKRKMSEAQKGKTRSEETRRKISESKIGENNPNFGKASSEETKWKMSEAHKGNFPDEETRQKLSKAAKGRTHTDESKQKISESLRGNKNASREKRAQNKGS